VEKKRKKKRLFIQMKGGKENHYLPEFRDEQSSLERKDPLIRKRRRFGGKRGNIDLVEERIDSGSDAKKEDISRGNVLLSRGEER